MIKFFNTIKNIGLTSGTAIIVILLSLIFILLVMQTPKQHYAFPSAEGYGAFTTGGRSGVVYHVRTLEDTNELGSLRYAINQKGPRTIVFDTSGIIALKSPLVIKNGDLTIAGQTSSGDGICIKDFPVIVDADNIIIRFLRFRLGNKTNTSALSTQNRHDIIIDHCSFSWAPQDNVSLINNRRLTLQWSIISEALNNGSNGFGAVLGGYSATYHHNLFASNKESNPSFYQAKHTNLALETIDFRNNLLYNWSNSSISGAQSGTYNIVNNYFKFGPATQIPSRSQIIELASGSKNGIVYVDGNYVHTNPLQTNDNWMGVYPNMDYIKTSKNPTLTRFEFEHEPTTLHSAENAYTKIIEYAGASNKRDYTDNRITQAVETYVSGARNSNGLISSPNDVGGYAPYKNGIPNLDSDGDGIPDSWEFINNLNPYDAGDGKSMTKSGYTNLEIYLNSLIKDIVKRENQNASPNVDTLKMIIQSIANMVKK